jgi:hypothetical protein
MLPPLTEDLLAAEVSKFARATADAFASLGFHNSAPTGDFQLRLRDEPLRERADQRQWHGRCYFRGDQNAESFWPFSDDAGVYLFFTRDRAACYVGKAEVALGSRIGAHIGPRGPDRSYAQSAFPEADYVIVIPFLGAPFLAPAFESYLLGRYSFPRNKALSRTGSLPS